MVKLFALRAKTHFDIPKTFPVGELSEGHAQELVEARKLFYIEIALVFGYAPAKSRQRHEVHNLRENQSSGVHVCPPPGFYRRIDTERDRFSSRLQSFLLFNFYKTIGYAMLSFF